MKVAGEVWALGVFLAASRDTVGFLCVLVGLAALFLISLLAYKRQFKWLSLASQLGAAVILILFRDTNYLWGDSRLWISALEHPNWVAPSVHSPGYGLVVQALSNLPGGRESMVLLLALVSVLSGLGVVFILADALGKKYDVRPLILAFLICQPLGFIFFGHIEPYALTALLTSVVLARSGKDIAQGKLSVAVWGLLLLASLSHFSALLLIPALLSWQLGKWTGKNVASIYVVMMVALAVCIFSIPNLRQLTLIGGTLSESGRVSYLVDVLNIWALALCPGLLLFLQVRRGALADDFGRTLALIVTTYALFPLLTRFELGGLRDLDLMGNLGVAWALLLAIGVVRTTRRLRWPLALTGGLGIMALSGIVLTTRGTSGAEVMRLQLEREVMSPSVRAYGFETLASYEEDHGNLAGAEANLREAIKEVPGNLRFYGALGEIQLERGDTSEAIESLWTAMKSERASRTAPLLGELLVRQDRFTEGVPVLTGMGSNLYEDRRASAALCVAYTRLGSADSSLTIAKRRIERDPKDALAYFNAAAALTRLGKIEDAIKYMRAAVTLEPDNTAYRQRLMHLLERGSGEAK